MLGAAAGFSFFFSFSSDAGSRKRLFLSDDGGRSRSLLPFSLLPFPFCKLLDALIDPSFSRLTGDRRNWRLMLVYGTVRLFRHLFPFFFFLSFLPFVRTRGRAGDDGGRRTFLEKGRDDRASVMADVLCGSFPLLFFFLFFFLNVSGLDAYLDDGLKEHD